MGESLRASRTYAQEQCEVAQPYLLPASVPNPRAPHPCHAQYGLSAEGGGRLTEAWPWLELEELWARRASGIAVAPAPHTVDITQLVGGDVNPPGHLGHVKVGLVSWGKERKTKK